jgi:rhodanese-related sulfurtransferase
MRNITVQELKERIDSGEQLHIIDVREPSEYAEFNIGGKLIPLGKIANMQIEDLEDLRQDELIIHCKAGARSMQACMILEQLGFSNVVNLTGGMLAWQAAQNG